jgi:uncharacterized membrane protein
MTERTSALILAAALVSGATLRFVSLGAREMSADEGASWAAASAPTIGEVLRLQAQFNAGKLALHDVVLHFWIGLFGDGLVSMRSMSAALGVVAIAMVYLVSRELMLVSAHAELELCRRESRMVAAVSALIFALSTVPIGYSREARMYPILLAAILAQVWMLLRAARIGGIRNYAGVSAFTAIAVAAHFSALCVLMSEGLWLAYLFFSTGGMGADSTAAQSSGMYRIGDRTASWKLMGSIALGVAVIAPMMRGGIQVSAAAVEAGAINWIPRPTLLSAVTIFKSGAGGFILPIAAVIGAVLGWRRARGAVLFALIWIWVPAVALLIVSYALTPVLVERYVLSSFVALFLLVALAVCSPKTPRCAMIAVGIVAMIALLQDLRFFTHRHNDARWREAAVAALSNTSPGQSIGVVPAYAANVVRYYAGAQRRADIAGGADNSSLVIVFDQGLSSSSGAALRAAYPETVARLQRLTLIRR